MHRAVIIILVSRLSYCTCGEEGRASARLDGVGPADQEHATSPRVDGKFRFLTFNNDASNIRVEMVFAIPFLAIPIGGKSEPSSQSNIAKPHLDVNVKSLLSMAAIMFMLFFIIPKVVHMYFPPENKNSAQRGPEWKDFNSIFERVDEILHVYNIDVESCTQKAICWTLNNASDKVKQGKASSAEKLLDALSSFTSLKYAFGDTWVWSLLESAISPKATEKETCQQFNRKCLITQNGLSNAAGSLLNAIKSTEKFQNVFNINKS